MEEASENQRSIIWFLWKEDQKTSVILQRLQAVFGDNALSKSQVYEWVSRFKEGSASLKDKERPGRPRTSITPDNVRIVEKCVMEDRRVTVSDIATQCGISTGSVVEILHDHLQMAKLSARWVPKLLGAEQKSDRLSVCRDLLDMVQLEGEKFWQRLITTDESWLPYYNPETKAQSREWRRKGEGPPLKPKTVPSVGKVMITVFWDSRGIIMIDYLPKGETINAQYYSRLLQGPLRDALKEKRPGKLHSRPLLQHDNARPHTANLTMTVVRDLRWELLPHPAYSPDLSPSDYHLFPALKSPLRGKHYEGLKEMKQAIKQWISDTPEDFFNSGLRKLVERWEKCIQLEGGYVEKCDIPLE